MIERTLEALEATPERDTLTGLDAQGVVAYSRSAREVLETIGAWQRVLSDKGLVQGDRVAIDLPRGPELLASHLAALASGLCVVPINPALSARERARVLGRAGVATNLCDAAERGGKGAPPRLVAVDPDRPALLIFTSGTTGEPKGAMVCDDNILAVLENTTDLPNSLEGLEEDATLLVLPLFHAYALDLGITRTFYSVQSMVLHHRFDAQKIFQDIEKYKLTIFPMRVEKANRMIPKETIQPNPGNPISKAAVVN